MKIAVPSVEFINEGSITIHILGGSHQFSLKYKKQIILLKSIINVLYTFLVAVRETLAFSKSEKFRRELEHTSNFAAVLVRKIVEKIAPSIFCSNNLLHTIIVETFIIEASFNFGKFNNYDIFNIWW